MFVLVHTNTIKNAERFIVDDINDPRLLWNILRSMDEETYGFPKYCLHSWEEFVATRSFEWKFQNSVVYYVVIIFI